MNKNTLIIKDGIKTLVDLREYITDIAIPNGIIEIGQSAFENCTSLTEITIPNSVIRIGYDAFNKCTSLKSIYIDKEKGTLDLRDTRIPKTCKVYWKGEF